MLAETLSKQKGQELAAAKWTDIAKIFQQYEAYFQPDTSEFTNPDIELNLTKSAVASSPLLKDARIWVDGFSGFNIQERDLLIEVLKVSSEASIALCLDSKIIDLNNDDEEMLDPCSLFASTEQTYCQLLRIIRGCKLNIEKPILLKKPLRFNDAQPLAVLERNLAADQPSKPISAEDALQITACGNVRAEAMWIAGQIRKLVKDDGYIVGIKLK